MKASIRTKGLACLLAAGALTTFAQPTGLGLKFAATDPDAATSSLAPGEVAGVVPQANWNNISGASGTGVGSLVYDSAGTASSSAATVTWTAPNTWRSGANNGFPDGGDRKILLGYLDTGNTAANGVTITVNNIDAAFTSGGYDVYVYFLSDSSANRGGGYTVNDGTKTVLKYGSTLGTPSSFVEDPGTDRDLSIDGNYLKFTQFTGSSFTLKSDTTLTSPNGFRAPINAIQIVPTPHFGPDVVSNPRNVQLYAGGVARFSASVDGYPAITSAHWQKDGVDLVDSARISASTTNLVINNVSASDAGNYTMVATSPLGSVTTEPANLTIVTPENSAFVNAILSDTPLSHWRLNEPDNVVEAYDFVGGRTGLHRDLVTWGDTVAGPQPPAFPGFSANNDAIQLGGAGVVGAVEVPTPTLNTNTVTIVAWIQPFAAQSDFTGLFMTRSGTFAGLGYATGNQLGYTWNGNSGATWGWNSGLRPADNEWTLVALVIDTNKATLYMGSQGTLSAAINPIAHTPEVWGSLARIGDDSLSGPNRTFNGKIDEVAVFNRSLSFSEVAALYGAATGTAQNPAPIISPQPASATLYAGATVTFKSAAAGAASYQWKKGTANVTEGGRISGATTDTLTITGIAAADAGDYVLVATNPGGSTSSAAATLTVVATPNNFVRDVLAANPLGYWRLNDPEDPSTGTAPVRDLWTGRNGTYGLLAQNLFNGVEGPRPSTSFAGLESDNGALLPTLNTPNSWATVPGPGLTTDRMSFAAWIYPNTRVNNSGILFARAGQAATGLGLNGVGNVGYTWNDAAATYNFNSGLTPPLNQWSLVAVAVEPTQAIVYMINANGVKSATNSVTHATRAFTDTIRIGGDPNNNNRTFDGRIDEAAIFNTTLNGAQLNRWFQLALGSVPPSIAASPAALEQFAGSPAQFTVSALGAAPLTYQWQKLVSDSFQNLSDSATVSGATTDTLTLSGITDADATQYRVVVSNSLGTATSEPAALTVIPAPPKPGAGTFGGAVLASGALSYWRLNETGDPSTGTLKAYDYAGGRHATYGVASTLGIPGPTPADGFNVFEDTNTALGLGAGVADSWVTTPPLGLSTDTLTITAWISPTTAPQWAPILFARGGQPATGFGFNGAGHLAYHWLDTAPTYNWDSGLTPAFGQWSFVALVVEPTQATVYLIDANGVQSAVNTTTHAARAFTDAMRIGNDPLDVARTFDGAIDEVALFNTALSAAAVQGLYSGSAVVTGATLHISQSSGQVTITWDGGGTLQSTTAFNGASTVWANETTTGNSLTVPATGATKFYRVVR